jgi:putative FmdB family regulatory protein
MPTYEYVCRACGFEFERFQSITASAVRTCPRCGARKVERRIGIGGAVIFKGGGFYETDYRSESYRKGEESERGAKESAVKSESSTADAAQSTTATKADSAGTSTDSSQSTPKLDSSARAGAETSGSGKVAGEHEKAKAPSGSSTAGAASAAGAAGPADASRAPRGKNHAREGRGIGNVLQLGGDGARREGRSIKSARKKRKK